jgi:antitoxin CptB
MRELSRLKWQCRRGSLELDLLLKNYLETVYPVADHNAKIRFAELLKLEDDALLTIFMNDKPC